MSEIIQNNLLFIVIFLLLIILLLMVLIAIVLVKLMLSSKDKPVSQQFTVTEAVDVNSKKEDLKNTSLKKIKEISQEIVVEKFFCENHPETPSSGTCLICEDVFCEKCIIEHESLYFCKEHFKVFVNNKWKQITDIKTTPSTPEDGLFIYNFKKQIWKDRDIPSFVLTHYKINIEHDYIESYIQLNVIESKADDLKLEIEEFKTQSSRN